MVADCLVDPAWCCSHRLGDRTIDHPAADDVHGAVSDGGPRSGGRLAGKEKMEPSMGHCRGLLSRLLPGDPVPGHAAAAIHQPDRRHCGQTARLSGYHRGMAGTVRRHRPTGHRSPRPTGRPGVTASEVRNAGGRRGPGGGNHSGECGLPSSDHPAVRLLHGGRSAKDAATGALVFLCVASAPSVADLAGFHRKDRRIRLFTPDPVGGFGRGHRGCASLSSRCLIRWPWESG